MQMDSHRVNGPATQTKITRNILNSYIAFAYIGFGTTNYDNKYIWTIEQFILFYIEKPPFYLVKNVLQLQFGSRQNLIWFVLYYKVHGDIKKHEKQKTPHHTHDDTEIHCIAIFGFILFLKISWFEYLLLVHKTNNSCPGLVYIRARILEFYMNRFYFILIRNKFIFLLVFIILLHYITKTTNIYCWCITMLRLKSRQAIFENIFHYFRFFLILHLQQGIDVCRAAAAILLSYILIRHGQIK